MIFCLFTKLVNIEVNSKIILLNCRYLVTFKLFLEVYETKAIFFYKGPNTHFLGVRNHQISETPSFSRHGGRLGLRSLPTCSQLTTTINK